MNATTLFMSWVLIGAGLLFALVFSATWGHVRTVRSPAGYVRYRRLLLVDRITRWSRNAIWLVALAPAVWLATSRPDYQGILVAPSLWAVIAITGVVMVDGFLLGRPAATDPPTDLTAPDLRRVRFSLPWGVMVSVFLMTVVLVLGVRWAWVAATDDGKGYFASWIEDHRIGWDTISPFPGSFYTTPLLFVYPAVIILAAIGTVIVLNRHPFLPRSKYAALDQGFRRRTIRDLALICLVAVTVPVGTMGFDVIWVFATLGPGSTQSTVTVLLAWIAGLAALGTFYWAAANLMVLAPVRESAAIAKIMAAETARAKAAAKAAAAADKPKGAKPKAGKAAKTAKTDTGKPGKAGVTQVRRATVVDVQETLFIIDMVPEPEFTEPVVGQPAVVSHLPGPPSEPPVLVYDEPEDPGRTLIFVDGEPVDLEDPVDTDDEAGTGEPAGSGIPPVADAAPRTVEIVVEAEGIEEDLDTIPQVAATPADVLQQTADTVPEAVQEASEAVQEAPGATREVVEEGVAEEGEVVEEAEVVAEAEAVEDDMAGAGQRDTEAVVVHARVYGLSQDEEEQTAPQTEQTVVQAQPEPQQQSQTGEPPVPAPPVPTPPVPTPPVPTPALHAPPVPAPPEPTPAVPTPPVPTPALPVPPVPRPPVPTPRDVFVRKPHAVAVILSNHSTTGPATPADLAETAELDQTAELAELQA